MERVSVGGESQAGRGSQPVPSHGHRSRHFRSRPQFVTVRSRVSSPSILKVLLRLLWPIRRGRSSCDFGCSSATPESHPMLLSSNNVR